MRKREATVRMVKFFRRTKAGRSAFTLIEILVVVAIIALLVAILLPSLAAARFQSKVVVCGANLHDLGNAFCMYANTFDGFYPVTAGSGWDSYSSLGTRGKDPNGYWHTSYLRQLKVLICPATRNVIRPETLHWPEVTETFTAEGKTELIPHMERLSDGEVSDIDQTALDGRDDSKGGSSYEYNGCYDSAPKDRNGKYKHPQSKHHKRNSYLKFQPATQLLVHDNDNRVDDNDLGCETAKDTGNNCPQPWDNHGERGMSMMFGDGHAEFVKKLPGTWVNFTAANSLGVCPSEQSVNASIDRVFERSQQPWGCLP